MSSSLSIHVESHGRRHTGERVRSSGQRAQLIAMPSNLTDADREDSTHREHGSKLARTRCRAFMRLPCTVTVAGLMLAMMLLAWLMSHVTHMQHQQQQVSQAALTSLPSSSASSDMRHARFAALIPIAADAIQSHVSALPLSWFLSLSSHGVRLFYVLGRASVSAAGMDDSTLLPVSLRGIVHIVRVDCADDEYPPIAKELLGPARIVDLYAGGHGTVGIRRGDRLDAIVKLDADTYVEPARLAEYLLEMVAQEHSDQLPVYSGRPLHHCQCHPRAKQLSGAACTGELGVSYCAGSMYALNARALRLYHLNLAECLSPPSDRFASCESSDTWFGFCMNLAGVECSPLVRGGMNSLSPARAPPRGVAWGKPSASNRKQASHTHVCQDRAAQGGVADRSGGQPYNYVALDWEQCIAWHPLKNREDMHFAAFAARWASNATQPYEQWENSDSKHDLPHTHADDGVQAPAVDVAAGNMSAVSLVSPHVRCRLAIGVVSAAGRLVPRDAIRSTWGRIVQALDGAVQVYFVVGSRSLSPHSALSLRREMRWHHDIVRLADVNDDDEVDPVSMFDKSVGWLRWAGQHTACEAIFKTDDDSYLRIMPLLTWMQNEFGEGQAPATAYFGWKFVSAPVLNDTRSPFHMSDWYPHPHFPPYMSGGGYGVSVDVAAMVVAEAERSQFRSRVEDAGVGVCIARVNELRHARSLPLVTFHSGRSWDYRVCSPDTIIDNPAYSRAFNMYTQFENDLAGHFCAQVHRGNVTAAVTQVSAFDFVRDQSGSIHTDDRQAAAACVSPLPTLLPLPPWHADAASRVSWLERSEWRYLSSDLRSLLGSSDVRMPVAAADQRAAQRVIAQALSLLMSPSEATDHAHMRARCHKATLLSAWKAASMQRADDFLLIVACANPVTAVAVAAASSSTPSSVVSHYLLHVPFSSSLPSSSFSVLPVQAGRVVVIVPFACAIDRLRNFLDALLPVARQHVAGGGQTVTVMLAWHDCHDEHEEEAWRTNQQQLADIGLTAGSASVDRMSAEQFIERSFVSSASVMSVHVLRSHTAFHRAASINLGLDALLDGDVGVVLDIDMRIVSTYLLHALAFTTPSRQTPPSHLHASAIHMRAVYFPICFSRYNPSLVPSELSAPFKLSAQSGVWRQYGFGMVALRGEQRTTHDQHTPTSEMATPTANTVSSLRLDASIQGWGHEDVQFHKLLLTLPDVHVFRAIEPHLVHLWHPKDCSALRGTPKYRMCIGSKIGVEGTARQIAEAYWHDIDTTAQT